MAGIQSVLKGQPFLLHMTTTEIPFCTETLMFTTLKWHFCSTNPTGLILLFKKKQKKPSTSKLCYLTLKGKKICPVAIFPNLYFWMMFSWTCLSSHLHACESGLYQKSMILQHSKFSVRRVSRPACLFIDIHL